MGRKYTKRLSNRKNTKRKNTNRKNTLKSRVSKRKNTLKSRVSKRKNSLNRRNNLKRLKKKRSNKKRLFKGGAVWRSTDDGEKLAKEIDALEDLALPPNPESGAKVMLKLLWGKTNVDEVDWICVAPDTTMDLSTAIHMALDTFTPNECKLLLPHYLKLIDAFKNETLAEIEEYRREHDEGYCDEEESDGESDWESDDDD